MRAIHLLLLSSVALSGCFGVVRRLQCEKTAEVEDCLTPEDDDCNGEIDEVDADNCTTFFVDDDGDGFGAGESICACESPEGMDAERGGDCDDGDARINPAAMDPCARSEIDANCDGEVNPDGVVSAWDADGQLLATGRSASTILTVAESGGEVLFCNGAWTETLSIDVEQTLEGIPRDGEVVLEPDPNTSLPTLSVLGAGEVTVRNIVFSGGKARGFRSGSALDADEAEGKLVVEDCTFSENFGNAAMHSAADGGTEVRRTDFLNNVGWDGGGLAIWGGSSVTVEDSVFRGNVAGDSQRLGNGGGMYVNGHFDPTGSVVLNRVQFDGNDANGNSAALAVWDVDIDATETSFTRHNSNNRGVTIGVVGINSSARLTCEDCDLGDGDSDNRGRDIYTYPNDEEFFEYGESVSIECSSNRIAGSCREQ